MAKYIIGAIVIIGIAAGGFYWWMGQGAASITPLPTPPVPAGPVLETYATSTFSIQYPNDFTLDAQYKNDTVVPSKPISGIKLTIPMTMATGTNLSTDTHLSVEWLPNAKKCTADIFLADNVKPQTISEASTTYSIASTTGAGAGNFYEEIVYALAGSSPCTAVRYLIHSTNIGNYDPGTVTEFDKSALMSAFDSIRHSLQLSTSH